MPKPKAVNPERFETCSGLSRRAFTLQPDTSFIPEGIFKIDLVVSLSDPAALAFKARVDDAAHAILNEEIPERYRDAWKLYLPYEMELSPDAGEPTGRAVFSFKRSATVLAAGTGKAAALTIPVFDSLGVYSLTPPLIRDNSLVRVHGGFAPVRLSMTQEVGVRMNFYAVKVLRLAVPQSPFSPDDIEGGWRTT